MKKSKSEKIVHYDPENDILYMGLKKGDEESVVEIAPGINVEVGSDGQILGIEILNAAKILKPVSQNLVRKEAVLAK